MFPDVIEVTLDFGSTSEKKVVIVDLATKIVSIQELKDVELNIVTNIIKIVEY
jgi:hypothetical protein